MPPDRMLKDFRCYSSENPPKFEEETPLLAVRGVRAGYGKGEVLHGIDLDVPAGAVTAVLGPNGAGKSTLLKVIAAQVRPRRGSITFRGLELTGHSATEVARCGVYLVPEGRAIFPNLSVRENLRMATARPERELGGRRKLALEAFPRLNERIDQIAGTLSGGEQQMLSLARAYIADPLLLLLDEPSLGLAPLIIDEVFAAIDRFRAEGATVLLVEQYVQRALAITDRVAVLDRGTIVFDGAPSELARDEIAARYLGS